MGDELELIQFRYSHYNEKARWALDFKGLPHRRTSLLPGPHMGKVKKLTGQTSTPVLRLGGRYVAGSAAIIAALEQAHPEPALYPADAGERTRALELQDWLDGDLGPYIRRALFSMIVDEASYMCGMFGEGQPWAQRSFYRAAYPLAKGLIRKGNGVTSQAAIDEAFTRTTEVFDTLAGMVGSSGYLVGDRFTVADLTAAALSAAAFDPPDCDMSRPKPMPRTMLDWLDRWRGHPWGDHVLRLYRDHRSRRDAPAAAA